MLYLSFEYDLSVVIILLLCAVSQSLFGIGVLLWGTPALLLSGLSYLVVLEVLLPVSMSISIMQILFNYSRISKQNLYSFLYLCIPGLLIGLTVVIFFMIDITFFVSAALAIAGILRLNFFSKINHWIGNNRSLFLPVIGVIHGISNLGGSMLVIWSSYSTDNKLSNRTLVAATYLIFASTQLVVLFLSKGYLNISVLYIPLAILVYLVSSKFLFTKINEKEYRTILTLMMFIMSALFAFRNIFL